MLQNSNNAQVSTMDVQNIQRFSRQSSLAPSTPAGSPASLAYYDADSLSNETEEEVEPSLSLMYAANAGELEVVCELLNDGVDVNFRDIDDRTALHIAACQGYADVTGLLIEHGAKIDAKDRWGSTPLGDAIYYKNHDVIKLLEKRGAEHPAAPMRVKTAKEIPEYEIVSEELDFTYSVTLNKGTFQIAYWRGIQVAVKTLGDDVIGADEKVAAFRDELALLQKLRHPNIVQFLGAVTQSSPMMIVTEYLPKGDLRAYLDKSGPLKPSTAVAFALDIARGMNYLHENKPPIIHCDLEPSNILRDDSGHLKVADFGVSKLLKVASRARKEDVAIIGHDTSCKYVAPEFFSNGEYDTPVDVFSFALILQEMIEGNPPVSMTREGLSSRAFTAKHRPPFKASSKNYTHGLRELIEDCWNENPSKRPTFKKVIVKLEHIYNSLGNKRRWKVRPLKCFQPTTGSFSGSSHSHNDRI